MMDTASPVALERLETHPIIQSWLNKLHDSKATAQNDVPNYWHTNPRSLISMSNVDNFVSSSCGERIYRFQILPEIATAEHEVVLVTCFWAQSDTLTALNATLVELSTKALNRGRKIKVRICLSSLSLSQKLFHTSSLKGRVYTPSEWQTTLGLPSVDELDGLDLEVKSIFILPFSVMHPKFVIVDRSKAFLPSCNVSWEGWLEGCAELSGPVVNQFADFWQRFWANPFDRASDFDARKLALTDAETSTEVTTIERIPSVFLPSPHHRNPRFALLPWIQCPPPPSTPLNMFLLSAFANAKKSIFLQTPNLTSPPVLSELLAALKRGILVEIITSEQMMVREQLITSGTRTERCVKKLIKRHKRLCADYRQETTHDAADLELGTHIRPGRLTIWYYAPMVQQGLATGPVQSHLKLTIIDEEWTVLGSGNMDRASWFTSQELGVAFFSTAFAQREREEREQCASGSRLVYQTDI